MVEVNVESAQMLAGSLRIMSEKTVDTSKEDTQLGGESRGEWGNLWK